MDWAAHYPLLTEPPDTTGCHGDQKMQVEFADIGCGYGGLLGNDWSSASSNSYTKFCLPHD